MLLKVLFLFVSVLIQNTCYAEVILIQAVIRHSDRNPQVVPRINDYYPSDPLANASWKPDGPMELNNVGKMNAYRLGQFFRNRYKNLLGRKPDKLAQFRSVAIARSIMTAQLIAAGLFAPDEVISWNHELLWEPIPIIVVPISEDVLNFAAYRCQNYINDKMIAVDSANKLLWAMEDVRNFYHYLTFHTGANHTAPDQSWRLYHHLFAQMRCGVKLPDWIRAIFPNGKLKEMMVIEYLLQSSSDRMKRIAGGVWIKEWLDHVDAFLGGVNQKQIYIYTGNDIQVIAILNALGVYQMQVPDYSATIIFELHKINGNFYVKIIFKNFEEVTELVIPGCNNTLCSLKLFRKNVEHVISKNYYDDCGELIATIRYNESK